jgi:hypothetical protein
LFREETSSAMATSMMAMFGFNAPSAPTPISQQAVVDVEHEDVTPVTATANEAFGPAVTEDTKATK